MSMTKKDFEAIAHCFTPFSEEGERGTGRAKPLRMIGSATSIVALLIPVFQEINPRFDMNATMKGNKMEYGSFEHIMINLVVFIAVIGPIAISVYFDRK